MTVPAAFVSAATEAAEEHIDLPLDAWVYPLIAGALFFTLFLLTYSFRNVARKH
ncbi:MULTISPECIES: hypothetical protein [Kineosporia]|uniref:Uncharacterized protein n=1 Tax=Kineosporia mesophila TaxID=566012 RepID=A0ABP7A121_9ACTN|nr:MULTISPECIES: hypothetical protein [Kineosporia]MCD5348905.1 hypothetical protein [Kineosporia mesophila]GLY31487.1 hypothetical protein Kisp02_48520 [Kineosporia sp. NBRC 101731]